MSLYSAQICSSSVSDATVRMAVTASVANAAQAAKRSPFSISSFISSLTLRKPLPTMTGIPTRTTTRPSFHPKAIARILQEIRLATEMSTMKILTEISSCSEAGTEVSLEAKAPEAWFGWSKKSGCSLRMREKSSDRYLRVAACMICSGIVNIDPAHGGIVYSLTTNLPY